MNVKKVVLLLLTILVAMMATYFLWTVFLKADSPDDVVKTYWQLCLDNKLEEAKSLTTPLPYSGADAPVSIDFIVQHGSKSGYYLSNEIGEQQIRIEDLIETKSGKYNSGVLLNTTNKDGKKEKYFAYLTLTSENVWKINRISFLNQKGDENYIGGESGTKNSDYLIEK